MKKQTLAPFRNVYKTILEGYIVLLYVNNKDSGLFTWKNF